MCAWSAGQVCSSIQHPHFIPKPLLQVISVVWWANMGTMYHRLRDETIIPGLPQENTEKWFRYWYIKIHKSNGFALFQCYCNFFLTSPGKWQDHWSKLNSGFWTPGVTFHCKDIKILAIYYIEEGFCHHGDIVNDSVQSTNKTGQGLEAFIAKRYECFKASYCGKI